MQQLGGLILVGSPSDPHSQKHEQIDMRYKRYRGYAGSSEKHSFEAIDSHGALIDGRFVPCFCDPCKHRNFESCYYKHICGVPERKECRHLETISISGTNRRRNAARAARQATAAAQQAQAAAAAGPAGGGGDGGAGGGSDIDDLI